MLSITPILHRVIRSELPPYDKKGSVTPVTGIKPTTTIKLSNAWKDIWNVIPKDKYLPNKLLHFLLILKQVKIIVRNNATIINIPKNPNSSLIIEKIKSVCGSGR